MNPLLIVTWSISMLNIHSVKQISEECNCTQPGVVGNTAPTKCLVCGGFAYGSHYPGCIGQYCMACRREIRRLKKKAKQVEERRLKFRGYSRH